MQEISVFVQRPSSSECHAQWYVYRASARPRIPAAPARLAATAPVAAGAPPVELELSGALEEEAEAETEAEVVVVDVTEAEEEEPDEEPDEVTELEEAPVDETPVVDEAPLLSELESLLLSGIGVGVALNKAEISSEATEVKYSLTLPGRVLYQAGIVPSMKFFISEW